MIDEKRIVQLANTMEKQGKLNPMSDAFRKAVEKRADVAQEAARK